MVVMADISNNNGLLKNDEMPLYWTKLGGGGSHCKTDAACVFRVVLLPVTLKIVTKMLLSRLHFQGWAIVQTPLNKRYSNVALS